MPSQGTLNVPPANEISRMRSNFMRHSTSALTVHATARRPSTKLLLQPWISLKRAINVTTIPTAYATLSTRHWLRRFSMASFPNVPLQTHVRRCSQKELQIPNNSKLCLSILSSTGTIRLHPLSLPKSLQLPPMALIRPCPREGQHAVRFLSHYKNQCVSRSPASEKSDADAFDSDSLLDVDSPVLTPGSGVWIVSELDDSVLPTEDTPELSAQAPWWSLAQEDSSPSFPTSGTTAPPGSTVGSPKKWIHQQQLTHWCECRCPRECTACRSTFLALSLLQERPVRHPSRDGLRAHILSELHITRVFRGRMLPDM
ncbi:hypothetical protein C8Q79DRAFT_678340 [Trametes meyenii]|nr:hypothetical protein C8Q79DRAFT_678340 [Trametes meyenii]